MNSFEWDRDKDVLNQQKHGISFELAQEAFFDKNRLIFDDLDHSHTEKRFFVLDTSKIKL
jgi:uncharacterized DUF497 family protein